MRTTRHVEIEEAAPGIKIIRFLHADIWQQLDELENGTEAVPYESSEVYQELQSTVLENLAAEQGLIINLGRFEVLPASGVHFLLKIRDIVEQRKAWLILCHVRKEVEEIIEIAQVDPPFRITATEKRAVREGTFRPFVE